MTRQTHTAQPDREDYGPVQAATATGLGRGRWEAGVKLGLIPAPDSGGRWSALVVADIAGRAEQISADIAQRQPIGAARIAAALSERTGAPVEREDVETLAARGLLPVVGRFKKWALYDPVAAAALDAEVVTAVARERADWIAASLTTEQACQVLGWEAAELRRAAAERGITARAARWARSGIAELAADEELCARVAADRLLGPEQAAAHLEVRRTDFDYLVAGGLLQAANTTHMEVGVRSTVEVALYRTGDLEDLREVPGIDWEELRGIAPGSASPLREIVPGLPPTRAQVVRAFAHLLGERYGIEVWPRYVPGPGVWLCDWEQRPDGQPSEDQVRALLAGHPAAAHAGDIRLSTATGQAIRAARAALEPGAAVVLDTETTGLNGVVIEVAVLDAATGAPLLDTLVDPAGVEVEPQAQAVHGIGAAELEGAPTWAEVWPRLEAAVGQRTLVAYNAAFDRDRIVQTCQHHGIDPGRMGEPDAWHCAMAARSDYLLIGHYIALGGTHRARGDAAATRELLQSMTAAPRG